MKKLSLLLFAVAAAVWSVSAQDILVKRSGEEIRAKVVEVGDRTIRYRKYDNLSGPIYSISRGEIFIIRYESGGKEVITPFEDPAPASSAPALPTREEVAQSAAAVKRAEREKTTWFGVKGEVGLSFWSFKSYFEEGLSGYGDVASYTGKPRMTFALSAFVEHFFKKSGEGHVGAGLGYMHDASLTSISASDAEGSFDFRMKYDALFAALYYGWRPVRNGFYVQGGLRFAYVISLQGKIDLSGAFFESVWEQVAGNGIGRGSWEKAGDDVIRSFTVYPYLDLGYSFRSVDLGLQYQFAVASPNKNAGNKPSSLGIVVKYRF